MPFEMNGVRLLFNSSRDITKRVQHTAVLQLQNARAQAMLELPQYAERLDESAFMQHGQELAEDLTGSQIAFIHFVNQDEESIELVTWSRRTLDSYCQAHFERHYPVSQAGIWADALRKRQAVVFNDYAAYPDKHGLPQGHSELKRLISVPVIENGKVVMLTGVGNKVGDYTDIDVETVQLISNDIWRIVQRKRSEQKLRIAAKAFETHEGMLIVDAQTRIQSVNRAFTRITGYEAEEVVGKKPNILRSGRQDTQFYDAMWQSIRANGSWQGELWNKRKDGEFYLEYLSINSVKNNAGEVTHYVGAISDITARKEMENDLRDAAERLKRANSQIKEDRELLSKRVLERTSELMLANKAKDSFLATMSHEIRTPLGGLLGIMELLELSHLNDRERVMVQTARNSGKSLLRIVNDILDWSKIEAGKLELVPVVSSIAELCNSVADTYAQVALEKDLRITVEIDPALNAVHIFDALRVSQILNNFTSNAIKFTTHGTVHIRAQRMAQHSGREEIRFSVRDNGIGISPEQQARLFQQYEQASADTARMYGGTGLGLAICRRLADLMEGRLSVESSPGAGSTFSFIVSLPVAQESDPGYRAATGNAPGIAVAQGAAIEGGRVLIVDDHPVNRLVIRQQLESLGLQVEVAEAGPQALSLWQHGHHDLIITDCHMPDMDGYELTRRIREQERQTGTSHIPIIAWTANVLSEEVDRCHAAGMDDLLTKPTELSDLRATVSKWLQKAPASLAPAASAPVESSIDFAVLEKFVLSRAMQIEMLQAFETQNRIDVTNLLAILKDGNVLAIAQLAHRIKGASRMVGATELQAIAADIERAAKQDDIASARNFADSLNQAMVQLASSIRSFKNASKTEE